MQVLLEGRDVRATRYPHVEGWRPSSRIIGGDTHGVSSAGMLGVRQRMRTSRAPDRDMACHCFNWRTSASSLGLCGQEARPARNRPNGVYRRYPRSTPGANCTAGVMPRD